MMFIDSNVLAYTFYDNKFKERCQEIVKEGGVINAVNLIEAYNIIQFETNAEYATKTIRSLLKSNLKIVDVDINLIFEALRRALKYKNLKFIDLIHYTTAIFHNCSEIASYDADFEGLEIKRVT